MTVPTSRDWSTLLGAERALLLSTYEIGRQPFAVASAAAWLGRAGVEVRCQDLAVEALDESATRRATVVALYLPMHTATRIAARLLPRIRELNPGARLIAFGLYAPGAADLLAREGVSAFVGGEFEAVLTDLVVNGGGGVRVPLERIRFAVPDRSGLPDLGQYARLRLPDGSERIVGATEASRGCKHWCRHCPVVPVYEGRFRVVDVEVVLADIAAQVERGAQHITFGDPDFLNGPTHAERLVAAFHDRFPALSYDVTIKVEHLLAHTRLLPHLRDTGCVLVTSAVESIDDAVLDRLGKGHTRDDFERVVALCRDAGLPLQPTFVAFHPWIDREGFRGLLAAIVDLDLVGHVPPIQLAIRLLVTPGSKLLELPEVRRCVARFDPQTLSYPWQHDDPEVDALQRDIEAIVAGTPGDDRAAVFARIWERAHQEAAAGTAPVRELPPIPARATVPYLTEPWYC